MADHVEKKRFYGLWTHRTIKKGEELTIDYVNNGSREYHDSMKDIHKFECSCTNLYIQQNEKRAEIHKELSHVFQVRDEKMIQRVVNYYTNSNICLQVEIRQAKSREFAKSIIYI